jgi:hypothetical protein
MYIHFSLRSKCQNAQLHWPSCSSGGDRGRLEIVTIIREKQKVTATKNKTKALAAAGGEKDGRRDSVWS